MDNHPLEIHMNTLSKRGRYGNIDRDELNYELTSSERLFYCLDGRPGSVIDELEGKEENVDNAARYLSENYGDGLEDIFEVEGPDQTLGFVALHHQDEGSHEETFEIGGHRRKDRNKTGPYRICIQS